MANAKSSNNKTKVAYPEKYTVNTISDYLAKKHGIPKRQAKEMLEDMFAVINSGVMSGERVPIGKMGKMFIRVRPATKARQGRNPLTGEEITIPAKKATKVPKFAFTKTFKTEATKAKVKTK
ncbi:MAG TPA: HU family DNA-binding protein [Spirochaetota bacterium]|nr:HU family DNA-binding protein [Spirochaetota bacterium]HNT10001.1 HU family DNA-binding protein [Spirochaetota bacterium]HNV46412.1 HU family DNA-binding protein [Spirochaetota bacterium]HOS38220.1 HU family DNA-binding protein [Spirochaetota bacterium]HPI22239.1 HU family DNA-binding protein [Spirochaetota bacterium]